MKRGTSRSIGNERRSLAVERRPGAGLRAIRRCLCSARPLVPGHADLEASAQSPRHVGFRSISWSPSGPVSVALISSRTPAARLGQRRSRAGGPSRNRTFQRGGRVRRSARTHSRAVSSWRIGSVTSESSAESAHSRQRAPRVGWRRSGRLVHWSRAMRLSCCARSSGRFATPRGIRRPSSSASPQGFSASDRALLADPAIRLLRTRSYAEATRHGVRGFAHEVALLTRPWGFSPSEVTCDVLLWHGEEDASTPDLHGTLCRGVSSPLPCLLLPRRGSFRRCAALGRDRCRAHVLERRACRPTSR